MATNFFGFLGYAEKLEQARARSSEPEGVICGTATIGGYRCAVFVMNGEFMMGSMGSVVGEKICRLFELATERRLMMFPASCGGERQRFGGGRGDSE